MIWEKVVTLDNIDSIRGLLGKYDIVYEAYSELIEEGSLTVDNIERVRANPEDKRRLEAEAYAHREKRRYQKKIEKKIEQGQLTIGDLESTRDELKRYNSLVWFCDRLITKGGITVDIINLVRDYLDHTQLKDVYMKLIACNVVTVDNMELVREDLKNHGLVEQAYKAIIDAGGITKDNLELVREDLESRKLMKQAYLAIITRKEMRLDEIVAATAELNKYELF
ncbi:hypothetical protein CYMTET_6175 [Cymbomonas tetramitiformis]|uniref:Uncharacterized protein n=1 Tax=Cymbomonas tetramitiformis TaxID=36881 RepID=A0AAE0C2N7_9CHLO|nr:hypothetical protein CYMTET_43238 [Cymbomonas tetramitiformis]KAK3286257.1 hypothetical protein CYMTET_6175 [Cymbomonas tetramitiformis]